MSKKQTVLPFIATHILSAAVKGGHETVEVMAVIQDGQTRLFDAAEAAEARLPEWKCLTVVPPTTVVMTGVEGIRLQKNRKDMESAKLTRKNEILHFTMANGELVSTRAPYIPFVAPQEIAPTPTTTVSQPNPTATPVVNDKPARKPRAKKPAPTPTTTTTATPTTTAVPTVVGQDGKTHRAGSVQGMTVEQLRAEFEAKTGQPAPSHSIHYMRKMVLAARNGKRDFKRKAVKVPTFTFTLDECKLLLSSNKKNPDREALKTRVAEWVAQFNPATSTPSSTTTIVDTTPKTAAA